MVRLSQRNFTFLLFETDVAGLAISPPKIMISTIFFFSSFNDPFSCSVRQTGNAELAGDSAHCGLIATSLDQQFCVFSPTEFVRSPTKVQ